MMKRIVLVAVAALFVASAAWSGDNVGVAVYPGSKVDTKATEAMNMFSKGTCYQTVEAKQKVVDFYKKQAGLKLFNPPKGVQSYATVLQGKHVQVRVESLTEEQNGTRFCINRLD
jgi:hypothetical protein